jgi:hypothetical protein
MHVRPRWGPKRAAMMLTRRQVILALLASAFPPTAIRGQQNARMRLIGWLHDGDPTDAVNG